MKRILAENVLAGIRLEYDSDSNKTFCIISTQTLSNHFCEDIKTALQVFDNKVDQALHTQPEKVMSVIDLENPPAVLLTTSGRKVRLVGNTGEGDYPYIISLEDGKCPILLYSNRDGSVTVSTSKLEVTVFTLRTVLVKKTGWINLYDSKGDKSHYPSAIIYSTRELAVEAVGRTPLIDTIQITWEE